MKLRSSLLVLAAFTLAATACNLLVNFDPEGQPCDAQGACLEGYGCISNSKGEKVCHKGAPAVSDCSKCPSGGCVPGKAECLPDTCQYKICPATQGCVESGNGPQCQPLASDELGHACFTDSECAAFGAARHCLLGAVQTPNAGGSLRSGVCVEECGPNDTCTTAGATCRQFPLGAGAGMAKVCLPDTTLTPCSDDAQCARGGLVCTVFENPAVGALTACDAPLATGAAQGDTCVSNTVQADGGTLCANGLCVPSTQVAGRASHCGQLCDTGTCAAGQCALAELTVGGNVVHVPMCVAEASLCQPCSSGPSACGVDAPWCTNLGGDTRCLTACTHADGGFSPDCPDGYTCSDVDGAPRCVPTSGACP